MRFLIELAFAELMQPVILVLHKLEVSLQLLYSLTQLRYLRFALPPRLADRIYQITAEVRDTSLRTENIRVLYGSQGRYL